MRGGGSLEVRIGVHFTGELTRCGEAKRRERGSCPADSWDFCGKLRGAEMCAGETDTGRGELSSLQGLRNSSLG